MKPAAALSDPDIVPLARTTEQRRRTGAASVVDGLALIDALRTDLDTDRATDILWTLNGSDIYRSLVNDCEWSVEAYATWLAATMISTLLVDPA